MFFKKVFIRFKRDKQTANTPLMKIPWNEVITECYDQGLEFSCPVVKVIYADSKAERAVIMQNSDMTYAVGFEKLTPFEEDELKYTTSTSHGQWEPRGQDGRSIFDTEERAVNEVFLVPPFKYNKTIAWAGLPFRVDAERLYWILDDGADDSDDFCLHGHLFAKIGDELFEYDATASAAGLYLLRTLTEDHIIYEGEAMFPCCGHSVFANDDLSSVDISGCPNGIDWSVIHQGDQVKLITESGNTTWVDLEDYRKEIVAFADKIEAFYQKSLPKNFSDADSITKNGYIAFWNEWNRRRTQRQA